MKQISMIALIAAMAVAPISGAFAQGQDQGPGPMQGGIPDYATLDADSSGGVTLAEMEAAFAARFMGADADGNGEMDVAELSAAITAMAEAHMAANEGGNGNRRAENMAERLPMMVAKMIERMDRDGNGKLSVSEMRPANLSDMFARVDSDDNGEVSAWEFEQAQAMRGEGRGRGGRGGEHGGDRGGDRGGYWGGYWGGNRGNHSHN